MRLTIPHIKLQISLNLHISEIQLSRNITLSPMCGFTISENLKKVFGQRTEVEIKKANLHHVSGVTPKCAA